VYVGPAGVCGGWGGYHGGEWVGAVGLPGCGGARRLLVQETETNTNPMHARRRTQPPWHARPAVSSGTHQQVDLEVLHF